MLLKTIQYVEATLRASSPHYLAIVDTKWIGTIRENR